MASVDVAVTSPAATFLIWRSAPAAPTDTILPSFNGVAVVP